MFQMSRVETLASHGADFTRSLLNDVSIYVRCLVFVVEENPQLKTGVGQGNPDVALFSLVYCHVEISMLIDVEDAPDLVKIRGTPRLMLTRFPDKSTRRVSSVFKLDVDVRVPFTPHRQVRGFGDRAFRQHPDHSTLRPTA